MFGVIGLLVLGFLWFGSDGFGEPPLFFKLFGSCIAVVFVVMGFGGATAALTIGKNNPFGLVHQLRQQNNHVNAGSGRSHGYSCSHCGAALGDDSDVSPKGDVKCEYCDKWFNIHEG